METERIYLSRLLLDMRSHRVLSELTHPYEMHRTLMRAFPSIENVGTIRKQCGVLFRADTDEGRRVVRVYVQSAVEPEWDVLSNVGGYFFYDPAVPSFECKEVTRSLERLREGRILAFRVRANPTKRVGKHGDPLKGKRVELQREEEQIAWLVSKGRGGREGVPGGFDVLVSRNSDAKRECHLVPRVRVECEGKVKGRKKGAGGAHTMTHLSVLFEGLLQVANVDVFLQTIRGGIGSAKACGFGLLSLAPYEVMIGGKM